MRLEGFGQAVEELVWWPWREGRGQLDRSAELGEVLRAAVASGEMAIDRFREVARHRAFEVAGDEGKVQGFRIVDGKLRSLSGSTRSLGLANAPDPLFITAPAELGFTPDGDNLIVTTKANGRIDVFGVHHDGRLSASAVKTPNAKVGFAFDFDPAGHLVLAEAGSNALSTYVVHANGTLSPVDTSVPDFGTAACWITRADGFVYVANAGTASLSGYAVDHEGHVKLVTREG